MHDLGRIWKKNESDLLKQYLTERLEKEIAYFEKLNSTPEPVTLKDDEIILENALNDLINKKIKKFKFIFNNSENLYLEFISSKKTIKMTLPKIKQHIKKRTIHDSTLESFQQLGFAIINGNKLEMSIINEGEEAIRKIRFLLVKIVFDILCYTDTENESYIEFEY